MFNAFQPTLPVGYLPSYISVLATYAVFHYTGASRIVFVLTWACARVGGTHLQDAGPVPMPHAGAGFGLGLFGYRTHVGAAQYIPPKQTSLRLM